MSKKITIPSLDDIAMLGREDHIIVQIIEENKTILPLSTGVTPYQKAVIVMVSQEKPKPTKPDEVVKEDPYQLKIGQNILFENGNFLQIIPKDSSEKYYLIPRKDVVLVFKK